MRRGRAYTLMGAEWTMEWEMRLEGQERLVKCSISEAGLMRVVEFLIWLEEALRALGWRFDGERWVKPQLDDGGAPVIG